jgi:16S rRNA (cytosine1402-N4)-methyltransferase
MPHIPVLLSEVVEYLNIKPGMTIVDATLNGAGHSKQILKRVGESGLVIGIELDSELAEGIKRENIKNLVVINDNYTNMKEILQRNNIMKVDGILFDFGLSSWQLDSSGRGFSFRQDEPLDMRFSKKESATAMEIVNTSSEAQLINIFKEFGEENNARAIAAAIIKARRQSAITSTARLNEIVESVNPKRSRIHPATKIYQALRIAVNSELENIHVGLQIAMKLVTEHGRIVTITYHSLEDRIVKNLLKSTGQLVIKKVITPSSKEIANNPRARSAKLRVWERI